LREGSPVLPHLENFERDGFAVVPGVMSAEDVDLLITALEASRPRSALERGGEVYASRNLLGDVPEVRRLSTMPRIKALAEAAIGPGAFAVRGLLFDKRPNANWTVPWHQDLAIAVKSRIDAPEFGPWTVKAGVTHVRPPIEVLARMVTLRLHLDHCGPENGPLRVVPGSHRQGRLGAGSTRAWLERVPAQTCLIPRGGALLMRPLLLHASSPSDSPGHRRVIHLEYAAELLPCGLEWHEAI
jgi:hypothetical protein